MHTTSNARYAEKRKEKINRRDQIPSLRETVTHQVAGGADLRKQRCEQNKGFSKGKKTRREEPRLEPKLGVGERGGGQEMIHRPRRA